MTRDSHMNTGMPEATNDSLAAPSSSDELEDERTNQPATEWMDARMHGRTDEDDAPVNSQ